MGMWPLFLTTWRSLMTLTRAVSEEREDRSPTGEGQRMNKKGISVDKRIDNSFQLVLLGKWSTEMGKSWHMEIWGK